MMCARLPTLGRLALVLLIGCLPLAGRAQQPDDPYAIGLEHFYAERYEEALPYFVTALDLSEERYGENGPEIATDLNNLAEVYRQLGRYDEAEPLYLRAIALDEAQSPSNDANRAATLNNLALLYRAQGRNDKAERMYKQSLGLLEDAYGYSHPQVAMSLNNLAKLYEATGAPSVPGHCSSAPTHRQGHAGADPSVDPPRVRNLAALDGAPVTSTDPLDCAAPAPRRARSPP